MHSHCGALLSVFILFSVQLNAVIKANGTQLLDSLITWNADGSSGKQSDTHTHTHSLKSMCCSGIPREITVLTKKKKSLFDLLVLFISSLIPGNVKISNTSHEERESKRKKKTALWKKVFFLQFT